MTDDELDAIDDRAWDHDSTSAYCDIKSLVAEVRTWKKGYEATQELLREKHHLLKAAEAEVRRLNDECQREADARGALERRLMQLGESP